MARLFNLWSRQILCTWTSFYNKVNLFGGLISSFLIHRVTDSVIKEFMTELMQLLEKKDLGCLNNFELSLAE